MAANLRQRVRDACEVVLERDRSIGPLELLLQMGFLHLSHVQQWQQGNPAFDSLVPYIECGERKLKQTWSEFFTWVKEQKLEPFTAEYFGISRAGPTALKISPDDNAEQERFFRTHFRPANLTDKQKQRIKNKQEKAPDLVVFQLVNKSAECSECATTIQTGEMIMLEQQQPLCLGCADLDHLEFLPRGDATLTRRARKHSPLSAIVKRFNKSRKRYQREGVLVAPEAIDAAYAQNESDADERAKIRERAARQREKQDDRLVKQMVELILNEFPGCPPAEAQEIAAHTAQRGSGRVGRSAAGRKLDPQTISLAVVAWIRHQHTEYESLLMYGVQRQAARQQIHNTLNDVMKRWQTFD